MRQLQRFALVCLLAGAPVIAGCKEEAKPNPDLKVPDVPESGSTSGKGDMTKQKKK
jgi:ABC-type uncharacterized transport system auxiliary subunit